MWPFRRRPHTVAAPAPEAASGLFSTQPNNIRQKGARRIGFEFTPPKATIADSVGMDDQGGYGYLSAKPTLNNYGGGVPDVQLAWYAAQGFIGYQMCAILAQHWLIDKACAMPAFDLVRNGYDLSVNDGQDIDPKIMDFVKQLNKKKYKLDKKIVDFVRFGRVFGVRHALFITSDGSKDYYQNPFNPDGIKPGAYKGISMIDPYWITPMLTGANVSDPAGLHFYDPEYWQIPSFGLVHRSHLVIYNTGEVADVLKPIYNYGGISLPQRIYERVYASERIANEVPMLVMTKRLTIMKTDLEEAVANPELFTERMSWWQEARDNFGVKISGTDDEIQQIDLSLTDLDTAMMTEYQIVAAIAEVPGTKLMGTQPKGFNSTGEYEESSYHEKLESLQADVEPLMSKHHICLMMSDIIPRFPVSQFEIDVSWEPLDAMTALEAMQVRTAASQNDAVLVGLGAIDADEVRDRLIADKDSGYSGLSPGAPPMPDSPDPGQPAPAPASKGEPAKIGTPPTGAPAGKPIGNPAIAALAPKPKAAPIKPPAGS